MALAIGKLKGTTAELEAKLKARGLDTAEKLFEAVVTAKQREELAVALGVQKQVIQELANRADLARIKGIAGVYGDLLEEAGVDTVKELKGRTAENLLAKLLEVNSAKNLTSKPPTLKNVQTWISLAKRRRKFLQY
jgi:predicted flap endonuclease-1-like 5' DNA nuclease